MHSILDRTVIPRLPVLATACSMVTNLFLKCQRANWKAEMVLQIHNFATKQTTVLDVKEEDRSLVFAGYFVAEPDEVVKLIAEIFDFENFFLQSI